MNSFSIIVNFLPEITLVFNQESKLLRSNFIQIYDMTIDQYQRIHFKKKGEKHLKTFKNSGICHLVFIETIIHKIFINVGKYTELITDEYY